MDIIVTGGAGFIGSALCRRLIAETDARVTVVDKLTYAASPEALSGLMGSERFRLVEADICDAARMAQVFAKARPSHVLNLAAETHVDRSIEGSAAFIQSNIVGVHVLLEAARTYRDGLPGGEADAFRFLHVSTDEVFGALGASGAFDEGSPYDPSSPYSASKAASDHLVRAWGRTYGLPVLITNCSNNYGPYQFPEKLIPLMVLNAVEGRALPVYGDGAQIRDWLHVDDHARALIGVARAGKAGETYVVGGRAERDNLTVVKAICATLDRLCPEGAPHERLIEFVTDRPGHDQRYAIDPSRIETELGWAPERRFEAGLAETVAWYLANEAWWRPIREGRYGGDRLGLAAAQ